MAGFPAVLGPGQRPGESFGAGLDKVEGAVEIAGIVGIGHPGHKDRVTGWVLGWPGRDDEAAIRRAIDDATQALGPLLQGNVNEAMKRLHTARPDG